MFNTPLVTPNVPNEDQEKVNAILKGVEDHLGFIPDGLKLYSISPPLLEAFVDTVGYFMGHPKHSQQLLAMIRYLVSSDAGCAFCIDFNGGLLMNLGVTADQLKAARENPANAPLSDEEKVILSIALSGIENPEGITHKDLQKAKDLDYTDRDIFDAVVLAANNKAFTHVLRTFKIEQQGGF